MISSCRYRPWKLVTIRSYYFSDFELYPMSVQSSHSNSRACTYHLIFSLPAAALSSSVSSIYIYSLMNVMTRIELALNGWCDERTGHFQSGSSRAVCERPPVPLAHGVAWDGISQARRRTYAHIIYILVDTGPRAGHA